MDKFVTIMRDLKVLARATTEHKKKMVIGLKALGVKTGDTELNDEDKTDDEKNVRLNDMMMKVSVTGEGINDVDALKAS